MNPLNAKLDDETTFEVKCVVTMKVTVPKSEAEFNGQRTSLGRAERFAEMFATSCMKNSIESARGSAKLDGIEARATDRKLVDHEGRLFEEAIFMGRGDYSKRECSVLLDRVEKAFSILSGLQQGGDDDDYKGHNYIAKVAQDVAMALCGTHRPFCRRPIEKGDGVNY